MTKRQKTKFKKFLLHPSTQLVAAIVLFITSAFLVSDGKLAAWEKQSFYLIYNLSDTWQPFFWTITQFGGVGVLLALSFIFLAVKKYTIVIQMMIAGLLAELLAHAGKAYVGRPRPAEFFSELITRDEFISGPGFPSGHTAVATAAALVILPYLPKKLRWITPVWIVGVMLSRVYLGVHAPMDLIGGFAIGWACVAMIQHVKMTDIRA